MRALTRIVFGSLLGIALILTGSTQAKADNCLLIVCVDAPIVGPIVGGLGDVLGEVLSPNQTPTQPQPPVQPPVKPPVQPPAPPVVNPPAPANPGSPTTPQQPAAPTDPVAPGTAPAESGDTDEVIGITDGEIIPAPTPTPSVTPKPSPSPTATVDPPRLLPDDEKDEGLPFHHVGALTPFVVGVLLMLLIVLSATSFVRYFQSRRIVDEQDQSSLPHKHH